MAVRIDISAFKRVQFGGASGEGDIPLAGLNWSTAAFAMQIRANPGDTGTALVSLATASAGSEGLSASYDSGYTLPDGTVTGATTLRIQINEATMEALAAAARTSEPVNLFYDIHVTPSGSSKRMLCYGKFDVYPGVTI